MWVTITFSGKTSPSYYLGFCFKCSWLSPLVSEITKIMFTFNNINLGALKTTPEYDLDLSSSTLLPTWAPVYRRKRQEYDSIYDGDSGLEYGWEFMLTISMLVMDVGDEMCYWHRFRCGWRILPFWSPISKIGQQDKNSITNIRNISPTLNRHIIWPNKFLQFFK